MPNVAKAAMDCELFGAEGITVHPRPDERHIRYADVREIRPLIKTEFNIEGNPIPSFYGEPEEVELPNTAEELASLVWENLNEDNKVSLFVRAIPLDGSKPTQIIINKNK